MMKWVKHPVVESNLRTLGVKFDIETNIPKSSLDLEEGKRRQVRLKMNEDTILRYAMKMQEDTAWNMVVLQKEKKRYWPWSGNQRLAAFDLANMNDLLEAAYVVEVHDPVMMDLLPRLVNTWEAVEGMSKEESIINARHMVEKHGMTVGEAAKLFSLKADQVYRAQRAEEIKIKVQHFGISTTDFSTTILEKLHKVNNNNALKRAVTLLHKFKVKGKEAEQIVTEVAEGETEAQQIITLEKWESAFDLRTKPKPKLGGVKLPHKEVKREQLFRLLTGLVRFVEHNKTVNQAQISDPSYQAVAKQYWRVIENGMTILLGKTQ